MWFKVIFFVVALVNVKAVETFVDSNGRVIQIASPSGNEGARYYEVQRGPNGEVTMLLRLPEEQPRPAPPKKDIIIEEVEPVKLPTPSPSRDIYVINERPVQTEPKPKPDLTPQPTIIVPAPKPQPAPNQVVVIPARQPEPAPNQVVVIPGRQPEPAPNQVVVIPGRKPEPAPNQVVVIPGRQPEPAPNQVVVIPGRKPEPAPNQVVVIPGRKPEPAPNQVVVIPNRQPEPAPNQVVVIPAAKPEPKPAVNYIVKTPVQPEPRPIVNVINQLSDYNCQNANGYFALQNQCNRFVECKELKAYYYECPEGMNFNRNAAWPNYPCGNSWEVRCEVNIIEPSPVLSRECPSPYGLYALPDNECSNYIACQEGIATLMTCPKGLVFNPNVQACDWLENMPSCRPQVFSGVTCPTFQEGDVDFVPKHRYGQSCTEYIACHRGEPRLLKCDGGLAFDDQLQRCVAAEHVQSCSYKLLL